MPTAQPPPPTTDAHPTLTWEPSSRPLEPTTSHELPDEVITCLESARFLHLATCTHNRPHVSLMNYTYLPPNSRPTSTTPSSTASRLPAGPAIIMTSNPSSRKTTNLVENPNVSLLVHDWVSSRPHNVTSSSSGREASPTGTRASSLANMLMQMNSAAVSSISATINGHATVLEPGSAEDTWCREQHLANNTFEVTDAVGRQQQRSLSAGEGLFGTSPTDGSAGDGGRGSYIEGEDVRVVVVRIRDGRISDWKGGVKDWVIEEGEGEGEGEGVRVNGGS
ncbi:uncharacterized protein LTR77_010699 [Saxophila tyrrhenica]|uniref:Pyridoxamine 5'-phosphate oxidase N-terminal domain-containing protein n=1 Tax=Saxophila tyrrhenica TaxID=1690608 RepID=A0AAV9NUM5_9PEZI|nr:hypothetical protein LTR77_010699 [Saxophila tyrrhenica]